MDDATFQSLVDQGIEALGPTVLGRLTNVAIVIADKPSPEQRADLDLKDDEEIFGLYEGIPQTERSVEDGVLLPDKITIFKEAILRAYSNQDDITACVANTVWHEVAHHFGFDEDAVRAEEVKRGKWH